MSRIDAIQEMLKDDPSDAFLLYALALEYEKAAQHQKAIEQLLDLHQQQPAYLPVYYKLGKLYEQEQLTDKAIRFYRDGIQLARQQGDQKTLNELKEALLQWEDEDE